MRSLLQQEDEVFHLDLALVVLVLLGFGDPTSAVDVQVERCIWPLLAAALGQLVRKSIPLRIFAGSSCYVVRAEELVSSTSWLSFRKQL